ncbi:MAG: hypothetical protein M9962_05800 [Oligoflexia bacterium]|nr:hypothetical protein [Oligoflexia bacterium]
MRYLLLLLVIFPVHGFSYTTGSNQETQEDWLVHTKKWNDYVEGLKVNIPGNIVKEFEATVKDKPFPLARKLRFGIFIETTNGRRVKVALKKNGEITFNGKSWRFKPLATIDSEVKRLAAHITGADKQAAFDWIIPSAVASKDFSNDEVGLAAAAFAFGYSWRAHACMAEELGDELLEDCIMMGAPIRTVTDFSKFAWNSVYGNIIHASLSTSDWDDGSAFVATSLKCPGKLPGAVEFVITNKFGDSEKLSGQYASIEKANEVSVKISKRSGSYKEIAKFPPSTTDEVRRSNRRMATILKNICLVSDEERNKYITIANENKKKLKNNSLPNQDEFISPVIEGSRDAT